MNPMPSMKERFAAVCAKVPVGARVVAPSTEPCVLGDVFVELELEPPVPPDGLSVGFSVGVGCTVVGVGVFVAVGVDVGQPKIQ